MQEKLCDDVCDSLCVTAPVAGSEKLLIGCVYYYPTQQHDLSDINNSNNNILLHNLLLKAINMSDFQCPYYW